MGQECSSNPGLERREKSRKYEELGKNEKRLLVISGMMFDREMGGNFEDRRKNIQEKERYIAPVLERILGYKGKISWRKRFIKRN